jgi:Domain of unknown function (DUF4189)
MKYSLENKLLVLFCAMASLFFGLPIAAQAQVGPCPFGGPSPGYRVVGQTPSGNGIGSILLCEPTGGGQPNREQMPAQRSQTYKAANFFAFAYHPDARQVWAVTNYPDETEAKNDALANCTKRMTQGCALAGSGTNTSITIFEISDGSIVWVPYHNPNDTRLVTGLCKNIVKDLVCYRRLVFGAYDITTNIGSKPNFDRRAINPVEADGVRNTYGSIAMAAGSDSEESNKIWVSTGHATKTQATNAALGLCTKALASTAQKCKAGITVASGVIRVLLSSEKVISFTSDIDRSYTWAYYEKECQAFKDPTKCMPKYLFDVQKPGEFEKIVQ